MTRVAAILASPVLALSVFAAPVAHAEHEPVYGPREAAYAQPPGPGQGMPSRAYGQAELDQMLAPVALYPDALLSQLLMAATYPLEIVQAARWSRANPNLHGEEAVRAVQGMDWDPSVKSMVAFPELLARMDERIEWTQRLGDAFLAQERHVMDTVQELRRRAEASGNLRSTDEIVVRREAEYIMIDPPSPERVYVPYYDTRVVYGSWWWRDYQPVLWSPWSSYYYSPGYSAFGWGLGVPVGAGFFYGTFDWPRHHVRHSHHRPWYYHANRWHQGERWRHDDRRGPGRHRDRPPRWHGDGDRRVNHDGRGPGREGWRDRDGRGDGRDGRGGGRDGRGDGRDGRGDGRDGRGDGRGQRAADGTRDSQRGAGRGLEVRNAPSVRGAAVTPAPQAYQPAPSYQGAPQGYQPASAAPAREARGIPIPPRSSIGQRQSAPAPQPHAGRAVEYVPQMAPRAMPAPVQHAAPASAPSPAPVRAAPMPVERSAPVEHSAPSPAPARESAPARGRER